MEDKQDNWEKFLNLTEEYQPDPEIANRVIEKINQRESTVVFKKTYKPKGLAIALSCVLFAVIVFLVVFFPLYCSRNNSGITLYTSDKIEFETIEDIDSFVVENGYNIKYFDAEIINNRKGVIKSNSKVGYIMQDVVFIGEQGLDTIVLRIVVLPNSRFEFHNDYETLKQSSMISGITVKYSLNFEIGNTEPLAKYSAKFEFNDYFYFLDLETPETDIAVLEKYINILIN